MSPDSNLYLYESLQLQGELQAKQDAAKKYRGVLHGVKVILQNEGPRGLFRGIGSAVRSPISVQDTCIANSHCSISTKSCSTVAVWVSTNRCARVWQPQYTRMLKFNRWVLTSSLVLLLVSLELPRDRPFSSSRPVCNRSPLSFPSAPSTTTRTRLMDCGRSTRRREFLAYTVELARQWYELVSVVPFSCRPTSSRSAA